MKKCLTILACMAISAAHAGDTNADVMKQIELLQKQIAQQQQMIDTLRSQMETNQAASQEMVKTEVATAVKEGLADVSSAPAITLGKAIDGLKIKGDLRLRYENIQVSDDTPGSADDNTADRFRTRFRLGGVWTNSSENWEIGVGLATGDYDGAQGEASATSTNTSWNQNDVFGSNDIGLDYAYAKHTWKDYGLSLTAGQMKNPFKTTWILWDSDVRPTGAAIQLEQDLFFLTAGAFNVRGDQGLGGGNESLGNMYGGQMGLNLCLAEDTTALLALGYYSFDNEVTEYEFGVVSNADTLDYQYQILDLYGELSTKVGDVSLKGYGQFCKNLGVETDAAVTLNPTNIANASASYDGEDEDTAWLLGVKAKIAKFSIDYAYAHIEGDSVYGDINDGDFGAGFAEGSRNVEGHKLSLGYSLTKNCSVGLTGILAERIDAAPNQDDQMALYQADLSYKF